ncbi:hypothetical protein [Bacillus pseudomycoides]|uniref:hypothetical protein n=1 Tax=Bacillus pseudomycoides TaxID=64104 RepID=UPI00159B9240|nr:hypothetical protein [Bacillus pseudomycoides]
MLFTKITVVVGSIVLGFLMFTVILQQVTQDIVEELLNQENIVETKGGQENV